MASAGAHGTALPVWTACCMAVDELRAAGCTDVAASAAMSVAAATRALVLTCPAWIGLARPMSSVRSVAALRGTPSMPLGGGGGWRFAEASTAAGVGGDAGSAVRAGPARSTRRAAAEKVPRGIVRSSAVASPATLPPGVTSRVSAGPSSQRRSVGSAGTRRCHSDRVAGQPEREVADPLARLAQRAEVGHHLVDEILLRPDGDLEPEPGDAAVPRVEVQRLCQVLWSGAVSFQASP